MAEAHDKAQVPGHASTPRWVQDNGLSDLSAAVDEIYFLRAVLADEAAITEAHLSYATFPKRRRPYAEEQVERMRRIARGETWTAAREKFDQTRALRLADADTALTNHAWAEQRGLTRVETEPAEKAQEHSRDEVDELVEARSAQAVQAVIDAARSAFPWLGFTVTFDGTNDTWLVTDDRVSTAAPRARVGKKGDNAEDCDVCPPDLPYPWICPGHPDAPEGRHDG